MLTFLLQPPIHIIRDTMSYNGVVHLDFKLHMMLIIDPITGTKDVTFFPVLFVNVFVCFLVKEELKTDVRYGASFHAFIMNLSQLKFKSDFSPRSSFFSSLLNSTISLLTESPMTFWRACLAVELLLIKTLNALKYLY